jgi:hypothetical protein
MVMVLVLKPTGEVEREVDLPAGGFPFAVAAGRIDGDSLEDLVVSCVGPESRIAFFQGWGGGKFAGAVFLPTISSPRNLQLLDLDGDGHQDLLISSSGEVALQRGSGDGGFSGPVKLAETATGLFSDAAVADLDGDGKPELLVAETLGNRVLLYRGKGGGEFQSSGELSLRGSPQSIELVDLNGDGLPDITTANSGSESISILRNKGSLEFGEPVDYYPGIAPLGHRSADVDGDGNPDLVAFSEDRAVVLLGHPELSVRGHFRRGDANLDGEMDLADAVRTVSWLFQGGPPLPCEDGADSNDDGVLDLGDAIYLLDRLFTGGKPLPPPGPKLCGPDPTPDGLAECPEDC